MAFWLQSLSDRGSSSRQVSRPSSLGSSISDIRDENVGTPATTPTTPITAHPVAAAAAALASGAMNANGEIDYKKVTIDYNKKKKNNPPLPPLPPLPPFLLLLLLLLLLPSVAPSFVINSIDFLAGRLIDYAQSSRSSWKRNG